MNSPLPSVLGIDPGIGITGYGVLFVASHSVQVAEAGVIKTKVRTELALRLMELRNGIEEILDQYSPRAVAIEQLFSHYKHPRTAIIMGHARGVIIESIARRGIEVHSISPRQAKKTITGSGSAGKSQMQQAMMVELGLKSTPDPPDVADALAIALCLHHRMLGTGKLS
ncbi:MAG: crossover junction endodeoxyribonuclease RuvC [Planctomycetota bacterium]